MKQTTKRTAMLLLAMVFAVLFSLAISFFGLQRSQNSLSYKQSAASVKTVSDETTTLVPGGNYIIIFSSDTNSADADLAMDMRTVFEKAGQRLDVKNDTAQKETDFEFLIGNTNRALSAELKAACQAQVNNDSFVWGFAFKDGKFAYAAATDEAFKIGMDEVLERFFSEESGFVVPTDLWLIVTMTREEYAAKLEAERLERIEALKNKIAGFSFSDFTDRAEVTLEYAVMPADDTYGKPYLYPTDGQHPRVNVTNESLEAIKEYLKTSEGQLLYKNLLSLANDSFTGVADAAKEHTSGRVGYHNYDASHLAIIEARAFLYLLTGDEEWGYKAILSMKNYFKTVDIRWINSDQCREFGEIIFCGAEVYDWCYDLLTEDDKNQFMIAFTDIVSGTAAGTEYSGKCSSGDAYMEVGYPPSGQASLAGHGAEHQILRDYLSVAIAIFDENPSWYNYVGARVYKDYVDARNYYYQSGTYPQGVSNYAPFRHNADIWSARLLECATGENPYSDMLGQITLSFFEYELPDGTSFGTGDGSRPTEFSTDMRRNAILIMGLYGNSSLRTRLLEYYDNFKTFTGTSVTISFPMLISMSASYYDKVGNLNGTPVHEGESPITYHSYPVGQMMARSEWDNASAPAVFMKIGERTTANHEHADAGSFQIYYKGLYSGESGVYDSYGTNHFKYYHQATVSHNSLLVYNPDRQGTNSSNAATYYYTGGQRRVGDAGSLDGWLSNSTYYTGDVTGAEYGYKTDGTADYAYLAGDITPAYESSDVSYVGRRMFTLFTGDETYPMIFITYDQITSAKDTYVKKFLLHTQTEPVVDEESKTVTVTSGEGRLVLHSLKGGEGFEALGGAKMNFLINGVQCATNNPNPNDYEDGMWGRVEISNTGTLSSDFLSFMYVTDATNDEKLSPTTFENENLIGTQIGSDVIVFTKSTDEPNSAELVFNTEGVGLQRYFITGLYDGTWHVEVDGVLVAHAVSTEEGHMISFYAPSGEVRVKPGSNIAPSNGGRIIYNAAGGIIPEDAPQVYEIGVPVQLPVITRGRDEFLGWYTSPTFEEETRVTELIVETKGKINIYANFRATPIYVDFEGMSIDITALNKGIGDISFNGSTKPNSRAHTVVDEETGNTYLRVVRGSKDPFINASQSTSTYISNFKSITYQFDLALDGDNQVISSDCRLREDGSNTCVTIFSIGSDGSVKLGGALTFMELTTEFQSVIITVDFEAGTMTAYDIYGDELAQKTFTVPSASSSGAKTTAEWLSYLKYTFNWYMGGKVTDSDSLLIDNIKVSCGKYEGIEEIVPEGHTKVVYKTNGGSFEVNPDRYVQITDAPYEIPTNITYGSFTFGGWYTSPDFDSETRITKIPVGTEEIVLYAKWIGTVFKEDFNDLDFNYSDSQNHNINGNDYVLNARPGSTMQTVSDATGNTYLKVYTDTKDAQIDNYSKLAGLASIGSGKFTYTLDLATHEDGRIGYSNFRIRGTGNSSDVITLFVTMADGSVRLGGDSGEVIATLTNELQKIIITLDVYANTITAYDIEGVVIASKTVTAPTGTVAEWVNNHKYLYNWWIAAGGGFLVDNIDIYLGQYIPAGIPEGSVKINYNTGGGEFSIAPDRYANVADAPFTLPTDITYGNYTFAGWYTSPTFEEGTRLDAISKGTNAEVTVYAKWTGTVFSQDFTDSSFDYSDEQNHTDGGIIYLLEGKTGSYVVTKDSSGNTYIQIHPGDNEVVLTNRTSLEDLVGAGGGKITFTLDLSATSRNILGNADFKIIGKDASESISVFTIQKSNKTVYLGGDSEKTVVTLTKTFQKIIITLDVYAGTLTAYSTDGTLIVTKEITAPSGTLEEWVKNNSYLFYWQVSGGDVLADNIKIHLGGYTPDSE